MNNWFTGSGYEIQFEDMMLQIDSHVKNNGKIFIGTDSQLSISSCLFAIAICLHRENKGGIYFFRKVKEKSSKFSTLKIRMIAEVQKTIETAFEVLEKNPSASIEIHIDVGIGDKSKTKIYADELKGWASATGFSCKIKPDAWASASVADKHTK